MSGKDSSVFPPTLRSFSLLLPDPIARRYGGTCSFRGMASLCPPGGCGTGAHHMRVWLGCRGGLSEKLFWPPAETAGSQLGSERELHPCIRQGHCLTARDRWDRGKQKCGGDGTLLQGINNTPTPHTVSHELTETQEMPLFSPEAVLTPHITCRQGKGEGETHALCTQTGWLSASCWHPSRQVFVT